MKLWILRPVKNLDKSRNPWDPWYDRCFGFVVRAKNETEARKLAAKDAGREGKSAWTDNALSTCVELSPKGEAEVVMEDVARA